MVDKFDAAVVGAGPAGVTAALTMAKQGLRPIIFERGEYPGSKNMMGGVLYARPLDEILPGFWQRAPLERQIIEHRFSFLTRDGCTTASHRGVAGRDKPNAFSVLRAKFDRWFAGQAVEAGAVLVTKTVVTDVLRQDGQIVGVQTDRGDVFADVVVAADGVNSLLAQKAGLRPELAPEHVALGVKEVIALSSERIRERFNLRGNEGAAVTFLGEATAGLYGFGFLYTNLDSLSLGLGVSLRDLVRSKRNPHDLLEAFKAHPHVRPLWEEGEVKEFLAHLIPEGGYDAIPPLYTNGMLVAGDAAMLVNAVTQEGADLAVVSGRLAGETVVHAKRQGDYTKKTLGLYRRLLEESFVLQDLRRFRRVPTYFDRHRQYFTTYPQLMNEAAQIWFSVDGTPRKMKARAILQAAQRRRSLFGLFVDLYALWRHVL